MYHWETQRQSIVYQKGNSEVFQKTKAAFEKKIYESVKIKQITNLQNTVRCHLIIIKNYDQEQKRLLGEESANMLFEYYQAAKRLGKRM